MSNIELVSFENDVKAKIRELKELCQKNIRVTNNSIEKDYNKKYFINIILALVFITSLIIGSIPFIVSNILLVLANNIYYEVKIFLEEYRLELYNEENENNIKDLNLKLEALDTYKSLINGKDITKNDLKEIIDNLYKFIPNEDIDIIINAFNKKKTKEKSTTAKEYFFINIDKLSAVLNELKNHFNGKEKQDILDLIEQIKNYGKQNTSKFTDTDFYYNALYLEKLIEYYEEALEMSNTHKLRLTKINKTF